MSVHTKKDGRIFCVYYEKGKQIWQPFGRGKAAKKVAEARDLEIKLRKKKGTWHRKTAYSTITFQELAQRYVDTRKRDLAPETMRHLISILTAYALPVIGHKYIGRITMQDWYDIQQRMSARDIKNKSINNYFVITSKLFTWAIEENQGLLSEHPWQKRKPLKTKKYNLDLFTRDEFLSILHHAAPHVRWALEVAYYTGVRPGPSELFALTWDDIDFEKGRIKVYSPKTDKTRWLNLAPEFLQKLKVYYLETRKRYPGCAYVVHLYGRHLNSIKTGWTRAKKRAGITKHIRLYDIRHFYLSYALAAGADIISLAESAGHVNSKMIINVYAHLAKDLKKEEPYKIPPLY